MKVFGSGVSAANARRSRSEWRLDPSDDGLADLIAVQRSGFVAGRTLLSALLNLPDVIRARHLMAVCMVLGAARMRYAGVGGHERHRWPSRCACLTGVSFLARH
jgi:hypothetical protein